MALTKANAETAPRKPGTYIARVITPDGRPRVIQRCVSQDPDGILDIGESGNLRRRLKTFVRCISDPTAHQGGHMAGWRYSYLGMRAHFPVDRMEFTFRVVGSKAKASGLEGKLLRAYVAAHFELPPLNYKFNWS